MFSGGDKPTTIRTVQDRTKAQYVNPAKIPPAKMGDRRIAKAGIPPTHVADESAKFDKIVTDSVATLPDAPKPEDCYVRGMRLATGEMLQKVQKGLAIYPELKITPPLAIAETKVMAAYVDGRDKAEFPEIAIRRQGTRGKLKLKEFPIVPMVDLPPGMTTTHNLKTLKGTSDWLAEMCKQGIDPEKVVVKEKAGLPVALDELLNKFPALRQPVERLYSQANGMVPEGKRSPAQSKALGDSFVKILADKLKAPGATPDKVAEELKRSVVTDVGGDPEFKPTIVSVDPAKIGAPFNSDAALLDAFMDLLAKVLDAYRKAAGRAADPSDVAALAEMLAKILNEKGIRDVAGLKKVDIPEVKVDPTTKKPTGISTGDTTKADGGDDGDEDKPFSGSFWKGDYGKGFKAGEMKYTDGKGKPAEGERAVITPWAWYIPTCTGSAGCMHLVMGGVGTEIKLSPNWSLEAGADIGLIKNKGVQLMRASKDGAYQLQYSGGPSDVLASWFSGSVALKYADNLGDKDFNHVEVEAGSVYPSQLFRVTKSSLIYGRLLGGNQILGGLSNPGVQLSGGFGWGDRLTIDGAAGVASIDSETPLNGDPWTTGGTQVFYGAQARLALLDDRSVEKPRNQLTLTASFNGQVGVSPVSDKPNVENGMSHNAGVSLAYVRPRARSTTSLWLNGRFGDLKLEGTNQSDRYNVVAELGGQYERQVANAVKVGFYLNGFVFWGQTDSRLITTSGAVVPRGVQPGNYDVEQLMGGFQGGPTLKLGPVNWVVSGGYFHTDLTNLGGAPLPSSLNDWLFTSSLAIYK